MSALVGELRHRLTLEEAETAADGGGGSFVTWRAAGVMWAGVKPVSGSEIVSADAIQARVTHEITVRWRPDVAARKRFRWGARIFDIHAVVDTDGRGRFLVCQVTERQP